MNQNALRKDLPSVQFSYETQVSEKLVFKLVSFLDGLFALFLLLLVEELFERVLTHSEDFLPELRLLDGSVGVLLI